MEQTGKGKFIFRYLSGQTDGATAPQREEAKRNRAEEAARKSCAIWSEKKQREKEANYGKEEEGHH